MQNHTPKPETTNSHIGCRWDPVQPDLCFDENSCGCYMDPCQYFGIEGEDCSPAGEEICCSLIETC